MVECFAGIAKAIVLRLHTHAPDEWLRDAPEDETNLHRPYGYVPPTLDDLHFCPDIVVAQCADLKDEEFEDYLNVIEIHIYGHITHMNDDDVERVVDRAVYDVAPGSTALMSRVQMQALDRATRASS